MNVRLATGPSGSGRCLATAMLGRNPTRGITGDHDAWSSVEVERRMLNVSFSAYSISARRQARSEFSAGFCGNGWRSVGLKIRLPIFANPGGSHRDGQSSVHMVAGTGKAGVSRDHRRCEDCAKD